jgi:hypothetical protein
MQGTGGNNTRPTRGFGGETTARPRIDDPCRSVICFIPDSPIFARDECETFPSAANAGAEERETKNAKATRVFIGKCLSETRIEEKLRDSRSLLQCPVCAESAPRIPALLRDFTQ